MKEKVLEKFMLVGRYFELHDDDSVPQDISLFSSILGGIWWISLDFTVLTEQFVGVLIRLWQPVWNY